MAKLPDHAVYEMTALQVNQHLRQWPVNDMYINEKNCCEYVRKLSKIDTYIYIYKKGVIKISHSNLARFRKQLISRACRQESRNTMPGDL